METNNYFVNIKFLREYDAKLLSNFIKMCKAKNLDLYKEHSLVVIKNLKTLKLNVLKEIKRFIDHLLHQLQNEHKLQQCLTQLTGEDVKDVT